MDFKTLDRVNEFLKNATPEDLSKIGEDIANNAPHLIQASLPKHNCERCKCELTILDNEICENCCDELAKQDGPMYPNEKCPECGSIYYEEQLGMCTKCFNYIQQGGLND